MTISFRAHRASWKPRSLNERARNAGRTRLWQACSDSAGCDPSSWNSVGCSETPRLGVERKSSTGLTSLSRPARSLSKSILEAGPWLGSASGPPTFPRAESPVCALLFTPASTGPAVKENQPSGKRQMTSSLTLPISSSAGSMEKPLGNMETCALCTAACANFLTSRIKDRLAAPSAPGPRHRSPADLLPTTAGA